MEISSDDSARLAELIVSESRADRSSSLTGGTSVHRVADLDPKHSDDRRRGVEFESMRWLKRIGLAGVIFFTVKGLIWLGVALIALVLVAD